MCAVLGALSDAMGPLSYTVTLVVVVGIRPSDLRGRDVCKAVMRIPVTITKPKEQKEGAKLS